MGGNSKSSTGNILSPSSILANNDIAGPLIRRFGSQIEVSMNAYSADTDENGLTEWTSDNTMLISIYSNAPAGNAVDQSSDRFLVSNTQTGALVHEYGHALFDLQGLKTSDYENITRIAHEQSNTSRSLSEFRGRISQYSKEAYSETFAEAFTDYVMSGSKARSESKAMMSAYNDYVKYNM